jgi:hypothetical protein
LSLTIDLIIGGLAVMVIIMAVLLRRRLAALTERPGRPTPGRWNSTAIDSPAWRRSN